MQGEEQVSEIGADPHYEIETIADEAMRPEKEDSIIKPERRAEASSSKKEIDLGGKDALASMMKSGIEAAPEVNRALLGEFKIQEGAEVYSQLPDYDYFRGFY